MPPWWPPRLADATRAHARWVLTSRNGFPRASRAIASRRPDLLKSSGGGANALLVRGAPIREGGWALLTCRPERRMVHVARLGDGTWVANLHASTRPLRQPEADGTTALSFALRSAGDAPLVFGGDLNQTRPHFPALTHLAGHHVDHLFARGCHATGPGELLDAGILSDHRPLAVEIECHTR